MANSMPMILPGGNMPSAAPAGSRGPGGRVSDYGEETSFSTVLRRTAQRVKQREAEGEALLEPVEPGAAELEGMGGAAALDGQWVLPWLAPNSAHLASAVEGGHVSGGDATGMTADTAADGAELTAAVDVLAREERGIIGDHASASRSTIAPEHAGLSETATAAGSENGASVAKPTAGSSAGDVSGKTAEAASAGAEMAGTGAAKDAVFDHGATRAGQGPGMGARTAGKATAAPGDGQLRIVAAPPALSSPALRGGVRPSVADMSPRERAYALRSRSAAAAEASGTVRAGGLLFADPEAMEGLVVQADGDDMAAGLIIKEQAAASQAAPGMADASGARQGNAAATGQSGNSPLGTGQAFAEALPGTEPTLPQPEGAAVVPSPAGARGSAAGQGTLFPTPAEGAAEAGDDAFLVAAKGEPMMPFAGEADGLRTDHPLEQRIAMSSNGGGTTPGASSFFAIPGEKGVALPGTVVQAPAELDVAAPSVGANGVATTDGASALGSVGSPWAPQSTSGVSGQPAAASGEGVTTSQVLTEDIVRMSISSGDGRTQEATLQLHPEHLGRLAVKVLVEEGRVHVHLVAEQEAASSLLKAQLSQLREALSEHGLRLEYAHVETGNGDESAFSFYGSGAGRDGGSSAGRGFAGEGLARHSEGAGRTGGASAADGDLAEGEGNVRPAPDLDGYRLNLRI